MMLLLPHQLLSTCLLITMSSAVPLVSNMLSLTNLPQLGSSRCRGNGYHSPDAPQFMCDPSDLVDRTWSQKLADTLRLDDQSVWTDKCQDTNKQQQQFTLADVLRQTKQTDEYVKKRRSELTYDAHVVTSQPLLNSDGFETVFFDHSAQQQPTVKQRRTVSRNRGRPMRYEHSHPFDDDVPINKTWRIGILITGNIDLNYVENCESNQSRDLPTTDPKSTMLQMAANTVRTKWSRGYYPPSTEPGMLRIKNCAVDLVLVAAGYYRYCDWNTDFAEDGINPTVVAAMSPELKKYIRGFEPTEQFKDQMYFDSVLLPREELKSKLANMLIQAIASFTKSIKSARSARQFRHIQHNIPTWALIAFAVATALGLGCAYFGNCISRKQSGRRNARAGTTAARRKDWGAGFGGGLYKMGGAGGGGTASKGRAGMFGLVRKPK